MTVQGPIKKQQPDGMSHGGAGISMQASSVAPVLRIYTMPESHTPTPQRQDQSEGSCCWTAVEIVLFGVNMHISNRCQSFATGFGGVLILLWQALWVLHAAAVTGCSGGSPEAMNSTCSWSPLHYDAASRRKTPNAVPLKPRMRECTAA